ncbi:MAG: ParB N-terminal domain-containing protein [Rhodospirillaceae bacterium]|jgi:ParB-like chromosome segregation protein Spo0J|nr:ParB N-terminal domain-containing protein [Rhodospirillales bacterium]MBT3906480.1 ParB N-terminal domain-containing protein [Rhodospirillaceae bacterium]MBT4700758.1 ParB N-terminal domain-containing protein [Rhodospirillaceae bacterium]MBT5034041.1 ParB N-terminal domain-containing protein [Rhodospirillaceae bacterium]MBT6218827.1 ParB N-terminal domain-containing protein [Rhodospirillaceae bacterium]
MKEVPLKVDEIYVPTKRRKTFEEDKAESLAEDILENGQQRPIQVRQGKGRLVLIEGLHRLEAVKLLGEETIQGYIVSARQF